MPSYSVALAPAAERDLRKLAPEVRERLRPAIDALATNPRPSGVKKLSSGDYRIRVGPLRVVYEVRDRVLVVLVLKIAHRREVYR
jgi:mRNA interferase RelE/StbE